MNLLKNSFFYALCVKLSTWFGTQFHKSWVIDAFSAQKSGEERSSQCLSYRIFEIVHHLFASLCKKTHLDRILPGSIFCRPVPWCILALVLSPFVPTMLLMGLILIVLFSVFLRFAQDSTRKLRYFPANKFVYLFAFVYLYASFFSVTRKESLFVGLLTIGFLLFYPLVLNAVDTPSQREHLIYALVLPAIPVSLYGFYQFLNPDVYKGAWVDSTMFESIRFRVYSTFGNPNVLGEYFLLIIPFAVALLFAAKKLSGKLFWFGCTALMGLCLILTYSRGCYLGLLFAAAVFLVILDRRFLILGMIVLLLSPLYLPDAILQRFMSIGDMADSSTSYRVFIWMGTLAMLKDYWFSGIGPGMVAFNKVYPAYAYHSIAAPHAHNLFLQILCDTGICGLVLFLLILYSYYRTMFTALRHESDRKTRLFLMAGISSVSGFLVESMTDYTFYNYRVMFLFWAILGISLLYARLPKKKETKTL